MQHEFRYAGETYDVLLERTPKIWTFANHCAHPREDGRIRIYFEDGSKAWAHVAKVGDVWWVHVMGHTLQFEVVEAGASSADDEGGLTAPMPGKILEVHVSEGQSVTSGDVLMVMEAMKMEHKIVASNDGKVASIHFKEGDQVPQGAELLTLD